MRNPNGYGNISKLPGNRRKPFRVRITTGWELDEASGKAKQQYKPLGYYKTRQEAMLALAEYHKDPRIFIASTMTFGDIFAKWSKEKYNKVSDSSITGYNSAYKLSSELHDMIFNDIKKAHLQAAIDNSHRGFATRERMKVLFSQLYSFALENDICNKDYSTFVEIGPRELVEERKPFTQEEIDKLFANVYRMDFIDTILIMIYTGLRIGELLLIETANVDIENRIMRGGIKTAAGKNRIIPINNKILTFVTDRVSESNKYLIVNHKNEQMLYRNYTDEKWKKIMEQLEMKHKPHDCRHTFATLMDNAGANKLCIKRIMGHASKDITDKVYTHKDIEQLKFAIDLI